MNTVPDETRKRPIAVADYHRMGEAGVFEDDERVELIEGEIYVMPPIGQRHASIVDRLTERFVLACSGQAIVRVQNPLTLGELSEPQPDISLLRRREDFYAGVPQSAADVLLVVEVADSSLRHDRDVKLGLYARHGVPEVWLIDVRGRRLLRFRDPQPDGYRSESTHAGVDDERTVVARARDARRRDDRPVGRVLTSSLRPDALTRLGSLRD